MCQQILVKESHILNVIKILPMGVTLYYADRQTDMARLVVVFCN
jgi:hypothetical protein